MKFCKNCGKELGDEAAFCPGCGTPTGAQSAQTGAPPVSDSAPPVTGSIPPTNSGATPVSGGTSPAGSQAPGGSPYTAGQTYGQADAPGMGGTYGQSAPGVQGGSYYQGAPNQAPQAGQGSYYPGSAPNNAQGPYYGNQYGGNTPYGGGPNYPKGGSGSNKTLIIIIVAIIAVILIGGGIFAAVKLTSKPVATNKPQPSSTASVSPKPSASSAPSSSASPASSASAKPSASASTKPSSSPSVKPSTSPSAKPSSSPVPSSTANGAAALNLLDSDTAKNVQAAFKEIGLDVSLIQGLAYYGEWVSGDVYSFTYKNSVVDLLIYQDGKVFSIETKGSQVYLRGYAPYKISDFLGAKTHYNEVQPPNGYVFYSDSGAKVDSKLHFKVADKNNYLVGLVDEDSGDLVSAFYVTNERPLGMVVPAGTYQLKFCAGSKWISVDEFFGKNTMFFEAKKTVTVSATNEVTIPLDVTGGTGVPATQVDGDNF